MGDDYKPFENLKNAKLKLKPSRLERLLAEQKATTAAKSSRVSPKDDAEAFSQAMSGVKPLERDDGGRELAPSIEASPKAGLGADGDPDAEAKGKLFDLLEGRIDFELEHTDEYLQGHVSGMDPKVFRQLKGGKLSIEAHLDLHGLNADQAHVALLRFIKEQYLLGRRCLLLIPGRGKNSPGGMGVLRSEVQTWLTRDPLRRVILAFATALPKHGGAGALYVLLRRVRKSQGKVFWDRYFPDI